MYWVGGMTASTARWSLLCEPRILTVLSLSLHISQAPVSAEVCKSSELQLFMWCFLEGWKRENWEFLCLSLPLTCKTNELGTKCSCVSVSELNLIEICVSQFVCVYIHINTKKILMLSNVCWLSIWLKISMQLKQIIPCKNDIQNFGLDNKCPIRYYFFFLFSVIDITMKKYGCHFVFKVSF